MRITRTHRAYRVAVAVGEQRVTRPARPLGGRSLRGLFPWSAVVAPWLVSRVISIAVLLAAVNDPFRGSRFTQFALKWDGAFYVDIARTGYGPVDVEFPQWPFFPVLPGVIRALARSATTRS